jgi:hypothetical protein
LEHDREYAMIVEDFVVVRIAVCNVVLQLQATGEWAGQALFRDAVEGRNNNMKAET